MNTTRHEESSKGSDEKMDTRAIFVESLHKLRENPRARGDLAKLRRAAGYSIGKARAQAQEVFFSLLPPGVAGTAYEETYFLVATLFAAAKKSASGDFGKTMRMVKEKFDSSSLDKRFAAMLDSNFDPRTGDGELPYKMRQLVKLAESKDVGVEWFRLLKHLMSWNHEDRWVQKAWARSYWAQFWKKAKE